MNFLLSKNQE